MAEDKEERIVVILKKPVSLTIHWENSQLKMEPPKHWEQMFFSVPKSAEKFLIENDLLGGPKIK